MKIFLNKLNSTQKKFILFFAGAIAVLAFAPFEFFPVLFTSFPLFFLILESSTNKKESFWYGWWFGFGHFLAGLYWICSSLLVEGAEKFLWLVPLAAAGIPAILAIYIGLLALGYYLLNQKFQFSKNSRIIVFINLWLLAEFARSYLFSGFPWNLLGYSLLFNIEISQIVAFGGVYLASFFALFIALAPLYIRDLRLVFVALFLIVGAYGYGVNHIEKSSMQEIGKKVALLQPNHQQSLLYNAKVAEARFEDMLALLRDSPNADYYIWPEATGTYHLNRSPEAVQAIKKALPVGAMAIIGADRSTGQNKENYQAWNSMYVISAEGIHAVYDKQHLVPFGEYVPLSAILPLENITGGMVDFSSGIGEKRLRTEGLNAIPLICYEIIFTDYAFYSGARPDFIINITNDAWFGNSIGPYQHLAMAQMRAIESGLPVLRAAKTGVSAVVDSFGVVQSELGLNLSGIVFTDIPDKVKAKTIYGKYGLSLILLIMLSSSIIVFFLRKK